ncbi:MAG: PKD domain-containing protein [Candidatus Thermoplasmatota archaeon]|nr:PKD domain-containing protein [Candidatus Thermoplasmatota archaeon]
MMKSKLIGVVFCAIILSSISSFSIAENIEDYNETEVITISSVNQEEECGLCDIHIEQDFNPKSMEKIYPHAKPVATIKVWTESACTGEEFNPNCDDDDDDDDGGGDVRVIPPLAAEDESLEEREIKNIIFNNGEEVNEDCNICGNSVKQDLISVQESITLANEQAAQVNAATPTPSSIMDVQQQQAAEPVEAISVNPEPVEIEEPCDDPCWYQPEDGATVTFYPPENVFVYPETIGLGCGEERYVTVAVRTFNVDNNGPIEIPYSASSINSFDTPFVSCSGMIICGVAVAWGYGADDPNLPTITINLGGPDSNVPSPGVPTEVLDEQSNEINTGKNVIFDASSLNNGETNAAYSWDFGDGTTSDDRITTTHAYEKPGEYAVKVSVEENDIVLDEGIANVVVVDGTTSSVDDETSKDVNDPDVEGTDEDTFDQPDEPDHEKDDFSSLLDMIIQMLKDIFSRLSV